MNKEHDYCYSIFYKGDDQSNDIDIKLEIQNTNKLQIIVKFMRSIIRRSKPVN